MQCQGKRHEKENEIDRYCERTMAKTESQNREIDGLGDA
jgi:hypothetical protein